MDLPTLLTQTSIPQSISDAAAELIAMKAVTRELGIGEPSAELIRFVNAELTRAERFEDLASGRQVGAVRAIADDFFRSQIA